MTKANTPGPEGPTTEKPKRRPQHLGHTTRYLTELEERQLFAHLAKLADPYAKRDLAWMQFLRRTGIRVGAFSRLTCFDAREALRTGYLRLAPEIQKRKRAHEVHLTKPAKEALCQLLSLRKQLGNGEAADAPLVMSRKGQSLSVRSYQARMAQWCEAAGLPVKATPHWWRHTRALRLLNGTTSRNPLAIIQGVLGHESAASTAHYLRPTREDLAAALEEAP